MKMKLFVAITAILVIIVLGACASNKPINAAKQVEKLADGFKFTEGPIADAEGNVYFTDQPNDRIMVWTTDGKLETFMQPCGRSNGLYFDFSGNLIACADEKNELWSISLEDKEVTVLLSDYDGKLFNGPNDAWVHPDGRIYFTDPFYKRPYWNRGPKEQDCQGVYVFSADKKSVKRLVDDLVQPNGIVGTPDGKQLYVADIGDKKTYLYDIQADGGLINKTLHCEMGSDGMTLDNRGNLYLTGKGVDVFNPEGEKIAHYDVPENWTANICFGGKDRKLLFITASKGIYGLRMNVKGVDSQAP